MSKLDPQCHLMVLDMFQRRHAQSEFKLSSGGISDARWKKGPA